MGLFKNIVRAANPVGRSSANPIVQVKASLQPQKSKEIVTKKYGQASGSTKKQEALKRAGKAVSDRAASESAAFGREMARQGAERLRVNTERSKNRRAALRGRGNNRRSLLGADDEQGSATLG